MKHMNVSVLFIFLIAAFFFVFYVIDIAVIAIESGCGAGVDLFFPLFWAVFCFICKKFKYTAEASKKTEMFFIIPLRIFSCSKNGLLDGISKILQGMVRR